MTALGTCVGDVDGFIRDHWAQRPLLRKGGASAAAAFQDLAALRDFDQMVASSGLRLSDVRMVKDGKPLPPGGYSKKAKGVEAAIDAARVFELFVEGSTIVLEGLHRYWRPLTRFCREMEIELGHRVQVNAYITPPGSQGFATHRDDHDVFVLQVSGSKRWSVADIADENQRLVEALVEPGDCLYIPRGFPHSASTTASDSAHLTVGILTHDSIAVVDEIVKMAAEEPLFQERLPLRAAADTGSLQSLVEGHVNDLRIWLDKMDRDELGWRVARRLVGSPLGMMEGQLEQLRALPGMGPGAHVRRRPGTICMLRVRPDKVQVLLVDRELEMPAGAAEVMAFVARTSSFRVGELEVWLDGPSSLVLVRRLIREGLLEVVLDG